MSETAWWEGEKGIHLKLRESLGCSLNSLSEWSWLSLGRGQHLAGFPGGGVRTKATPSRRDFPARYYRKCASDLRRDYVYRWTQGQEHNLIHMGSWAICPIKIVMRLLLLSSQIQIVHRPVKVLRAFSHWPVENSSSWPILASGKLLESLTNMGSPQI